MRTSEGTEKEGAAGNVDSSSKHPITCPPDINIIASTKITDSAEYSPVATDDLNPRTSEVEVRRPSFYPASCVGETKEFTKNRTRGTH